MLAMLALIAVGSWHFQKLSIDAVPDITNVQVQINTEAQGYSPLEVEQRITYPLENALYGLPKLSYTRSLSRYGLSQITVVFEDGTDVYFARTLIAERLNAVARELPADIALTMGPIATGLGEIFTYTLSAHDAKITQMDLWDIQQWVIKPQLAKVKGVVEINAIGGQERQFHVSPDLVKLLQFGLTLEDLSDALMQHNSNRGLGFIERGGEQILVRSQGQLQSLSDIENIIVAKRAVGPVLVKDVAQVHLGSALRTGAATQNGQEVVMGTAMMLVGENAREVAKAIAEKIEAIKPSLPAGVTLQTVYDRTALVNKTIDTVQKNLVEGALLVIAVLFLMLGNLRAALITALVIPLTMLATITGMVHTKVSANLMSLGALDFGLIVDGAVIVVENAIRRLNLARAAAGQSLVLKERLAVVYESTSEVMRPSLFGIAIITLVYIPIFTLTGVEGKMFHPMAATVVMALMCALVLTLTFIPAAVALFIHGNGTAHEGVVYRNSVRAYRALLRVTIKTAPVLLVAAIALVASTAWLATRLGSEFMPELDEGDIALHAIRVTGTSLSQSVHMQTQLEARLKAFDEVHTVFAKIGTPDIATDPMPPNVADNFVILNPRNDWPDPSKTKAQLIQEMAAALDQIPGNNYEFTQPIEMRFNELIAGVRTDVAVKIFGDDLDTLQTIAEQVNAILQAVNGAADARVEPVDGLPVLTITAKPLMLSQYGLSLEAFQHILAMLMGGFDVGGIYDGDKRYDLQVRLSGLESLSLSQMAELPIPLGEGTFVPLGEVANITQALGPAQISREDGKRRIVVTSNVRGRDLGSFVTELQNKLSQEVTLPEGYWVNYGGTYEQLQSASQRLSIIVPVTLLLIIALLMMAFNAIKDALIIFTGVPLALSGGVLALWLREMPFSISAGVGFIALSGVAVLNGLVMVSFIREQMMTQKDALAAVIDGAALRARPVLMTALVASLGFVPMALNTGTGAEVQRPLATVVIGGITTSTLLTLFVLPALYYWLRPRKASFSSE